MDHMLDSEIAKDRQECKAARFPAHKRLEVMRARLRLLVKEWDQYLDHKKVVEDILKEPNMLFS